MRQRFESREIFLSWFEFRFSREILHCREREHLAKSFYGIITNWIEKYARAYIITYVSYRVYYMSNNNVIRSLLKVFVRISLTAATDRSRFHFRIAIFKAFIHGFFRNINIRVIFENKKYLIIRHQLVSCLNIWCDVLKINLLNFWPLRHMFLKSKNKPFFAR